MDVKFTIRDTLPDLNTYTEANRMVIVKKDGKRWYKGAQMKKTAQEQCAWAIKTQCRGKHLDKCHVNIKWYEPNAKRDPDNIVFAKKFILDALVTCGVLDNDGQKQILSFQEEWLVDKLNPRIEVTLIEPTS